MFEALLKIYFATFVRPAAIPIPRRQNPQNPKIENRKILRRRTDPRSLGDEAIIDSRPILVDYWSQPVLGSVILPTP
jgi:hypothetical protein